MLKSLYLISETMRYPPEEWGIRSEEMFGSHEASDTELPLIADVLVMGGAAAFTLTLERWPRDVVIKISTTTSDWFDVEER